MLLFDRFLLFGFVTMLLVCVPVFLLKCASDGVILVVVFGMSFMFSIIADISFAIVTFDQFLSTLIAANRLFIDWISLSTIHVHLWSPAGAKISFMLLSSQKTSKLCALKACALSHLIDLGIPWNLI